MVSMERLRETMASHPPRLPRAAVKLSGLPPYLHEDFLENVFSGGRVAENAQGDGVDELGIPVVQGGHCLVVALLNGGKELWIVLHDFGAACFGLRSLYS